MNQETFSLTNYDFQIPASKIAQEPVSPRDSSRLLVIDRQKQSIKEDRFRDIINYLNKGDCLVLNNTKVIKARLIAQKKTGAKIELLLLKRITEGTWEALVKPGKRARLGDVFYFKGGDYQAKVIDTTKSGARIFEFKPKDLERYLEKIGKVPLPHYIKRELDDLAPYQTVYAKHEGAVAAPTAGLHFTPELIQKIKEKGIEIVYVTLHCGLATFRPVKTKDIRDHKIESEWIEVPKETAKAINTAKKRGSKVIGVGTTAVRSLETAAYLEKDGKTKVKEFIGETGLYIVPGYKFKIIDALITNFHTPHSTNLILVSCFAGGELIKKSYSLAKSKDFRFFSFGDATLML